MTKDDVVDALEDSHEQFLDALEGLSDEQMQEPGVVGGWSVKDLVSHLSAWEAELVKLLWQVQQGQRPSSAQFSSTPVDELNALWHEETAGRDLERALADFHAVRKQTIRRVESFSDRDLNDPQRYAWAKGQPLYKIIGDDSFEHEAEHVQQIQEWRAGRGI